MHLPFDVGCPYCVKFGGARLPVGGAIKALNSAL